MGALEKWLIGLFKNAYVLLASPLGLRGKNTPSAIILLNTDMGREKDVLRSLRSDGGAVESVYDIVVKVKAETFDKLKEIIARIKRTLIAHDVVTMVLVEGSGNALD